MKDVTNRQNEAWQKDGVYINIYQYIFSQCENNLITLLNYNENISGCFENQFIGNYKSA